MAVSTHVFFNSKKSLGDAAEELGKLLTLQFRFIEGDFKSYGAEGCMMALRLFDDHGFEDDKQIPFERFRYWLKFDCLYRLDVYPYNEQMRQATARLTYHLITSQLGYPAMLVEDLQTLVEINEVPKKIENFTH
jgi:hypothetical protein